MYQVVYINWLQLRFLSIELCVRERDRDEEGDTTFDALNIVLQ